MRSFIRFCNYARIFATLETLVCPSVSKDGRDPGGVRHQIKSSRRDAVGSGAVANEQTGVGQLASTEQPDACRPGFRPLKKLAFGPFQIYPSEGQT